MASGSMSSVSDAASQFSYKGQGFPETLQCPFHKVISERFLKFPERLLEKSKLCQKNQSDSKITKSFATVSEPFTKPTQQSIHSILEIFQEETWGFIIWKLVLPFQILLGSIQASTFSSHIGNQNWTGSARKNDNRIQLIPCAESEH